MSSPEIRAALKTAARYPETFAYHLAQEEAADNASAPTAAAMVAARLHELTGTPEARARFTAYLDQLQQTHGHEPAMAAYLATTRTTITAAAATPEATTP